MTIYYGLESISSLFISNIFVEYDCFELIKLLNGEAVDISKVSFFIGETKERGDELGVVAFSNVLRHQNELAHWIARRVLQDQGFTILQIPYLEWLTLGLAQDGIL